MESINEGEWLCAVRLSAANNYNSTQLQNLISFSVVNQIIISFLAKAAFRQGW